MYLKNLIEYLSAIYNEHGDIPCYMDIDGLMKVELNISTDYTHAGIQPTKKFISFKRAYVTSSVLRKSENPYDLAKEATDEKIK
jgi:hypothetical protein